MKTNTILILSITFLAFAGCRSDNDLQKTIFYPDPELPELPIYSEWGYNTFGAFLDREAFISSESKIPLKVIVENNISSFRISGNLGYYKEMQFTLKMNNFSPNDYSELIQLNKQEIDLTNATYEIEISIEGETHATQILDGSFNFKRAQNLSVDFEPVEVILSGTFELQLILDDEPVTISDGRFDFGVGKDNFFEL